MGKRRSLLWPPILGLICLGSGSAAANGPARSKPSIAAVRVEKGPVVDGKLDDPVWAKAPAGGPLTQYLPAQNAPMSERTEFRIVFDDENIYLGVWCYDSEPDKIVARLMKREGSLWLDDNIIFVFDPFHDFRNGYVFFVNPNGARRDGLVSNSSLENHDWDGIWTARATIDEEGWKMEAAIPFKTLSLDPDQSTWGFNLQRTIQRRAEMGRWSAAEPQFQTGNISVAGNLTGLVNLPQNAGLEFRPYVVARAGTKDDTFFDESDFGGDFRYRITPFLSSTLSYHTDFAETEVDTRQLNFTRFPLFFPEKRHFFLEDSGVFNFAGLQSYDLLPFFSRRIGLSDTGEVVPLLGAAKVAGQVGPYEVGFIDAYLEEHGDIAAKNVFAGRISRDIFKQSSAGLIFTGGDPNSANDNTLIGSDFRFRTTEFRGDKTLEANLYVLGNQVETESDSEFKPAWGVGLDYPNDLFNANARVYEIARDFHPSLGFVPRTDVRAWKSNWSVRPRPAAIDSIRQFRFTYGNEIYTDLSDNLETSTHWFMPLFIDFTSSDTLSFFVNRQFDAPIEPFIVGGEVAIPSGEYQWTEYVAGVELAPRRLVSGYAQVALGEFYDGTRQRYLLGLDILPGRHVSFRLDYDYNLVDLPGGEFETHLGGVRMGWHFTPDLLWSHLIQYDSISDSIGYQGRIEWEFRPGSTAYLVYNQSYERQPFNRYFAPGDAEAIFKLGMTFRF
ncbi:MAG: carbohydrate binding family 9 domain-containing protein [Verrucomicrobiae bacterium]|nr:carbohydrate binding family 9 domain-containing protein [Verrucomicrobiae bacterium]